MILIVNAENRSLFESELIEMHRQRKGVCGEDRRVMKLSSLERAMRSVN